MPRAQPNPSPTDRYAKMIAAALAKGQPPARTAGLEFYLESSPDEIFAAFQGMARHMPPAGEDAGLAAGYLLLLQLLLERLRYRTDSGYEDAARLIGDFQEKVAALSAAGHVDGGVLAYVGQALHQAKIRVSPSLAAESNRRCAVDAASTPLPDDLGSAVAGILETCGGDPFAFVGSLAEFEHALPTKTRGALASSLALAGAAEGRAVAVLFLLDPEAPVRRQVAGALRQTAASLSPTDIRRLIAIRNWRPSDERGEIDTIIHKARAAGIACAERQAGRAEEIRATAIDGAGAQGFLLVSPAGRKKRMSLILVKGGVADAWSGEPESARRVSATIAGAETPMLSVAQSYLDRVVADALAVGIEKGEVPPFGLLQIAETIGGVDWQPAHMAFGDIATRLINEIPGEMRGAAAVETVLRRSDELIDLEFVAQSWFEDGAEIAQAVAKSRGAKPAKLATYLLQTVMAHRRGKWADLLLRTALWMREASAETELCWRELAMVARALADGRDLTEIGLMREIALRTISVHRDAAFR